MFQILKSAVQAFFAGKSLQMSASLSYYSLLSMAPLLLVVTGVASILFDEAAVRQALIDQMDQLVGSEGAELTATVMNNMARPERGLISTLIGVSLMLVGATTVFAQLQGAMNEIWRVKAKPGNAIGKFLKQRLVALTIVVGIAFLLLVSLTLSALLAGLQNYLDSVLPGSVTLWRILNVVLSLGISTVLFALIFRIVPDAVIAWRDTWLGAFITALLFAVGKFGIGLYLGQASVGSAYGAAGSLVVFMVWIYYASLIVFLGAQITRVIAESRGGIVAMAHAEVTSD